MAKALGTTVEEEHRMGLHKLAQVCPHIDPHLKLMVFSANKRTGGVASYRLRTPRSHRVVR